MHESAFLAMLPWFAHYGHTNYMRWGTVSVTYVNLLDVSHPDVHRQFMDGNFVVKSTHKTFNQIGTDLALEQVNEVGKVAGGLVGITRLDSARDKWCLTYNERGRLVDKTSVMFSLAVDNVQYTPFANKDVGTSRIKRDIDDIQKLVYQLERFSVFNTHCPDLICLANRYIAPESIKTAMLIAQTHGEDKIKEFMETRLCKREVGFHVKLKQSQSVSLKNVYIVEKKTDPKQKGKTIKADKVLFQRLLVAKYAGCQIDLMKLLCHVFSLVTLAIAGNL